MVARYAYWLGVFALIICGAKPGFLPAQSDFEPDLERLEQRIEEWRESGEVVGLSVGFMKGDFVWAKGFGLANLETRSPCSKDSSYRMASVTKPMTAVAVLQLAEKGKVDLDGEVQKYVPYFPQKPWPVTARRLLGHLGGVSHYRSFEGELDIKEPKTTREAIAIFEDFELVAEPGTRYTYSSYGYNLLGAVIEGAAGKPFGEYMRQHVWGPAGMTNTLMDDPRAIIPHRVRGYVREDGKLRNSVYVDISSRFAAGGTRSTVIDMLQFARAVWSHKLLAPETTDQMLTSLATSAGIETGYGLGWGVTPVNGRFRVGHTGGQAETRTELMVFPREQCAIAMATNYESIPNRRVTGLVYETIFNEPFDRDFYLLDAEAQPLLTAIRTAFDYGLSYYDRYRRALTEDRLALKSAFDAFARFHHAGVRSPESQKWLREARHPAGERALVVIGSHVAATLAAAGNEQLATYHRSGPLAFFVDHEEQVDAGESELRFPDAVVERLRRWHHDWKRSSERVPWSLSITANTDLDALEKQLRSAFQECQVVPAFGPALEAAAEAAFVAKDLPRAHTLSRLAADLYPASAGPKVALAILHLAKEETEPAQAALTQATAAPYGTNAASASGLNQMAYDLHGAGSTALAIRLLKCAIDLYPKEANLYDSVGEMYLHLGERDTGIRWYRKALEVDPEFENAKRVLAEIEAKRE